MMAPVTSRFAAILAAAAGLCAGWLLADDRVTFQPSRSDGPSPPLVAGRPLVQTFVPPTDGLEAVAVRIATYRQVVDGSVRIELRGPLDADGVGGSGGQDDVGNSVGTVGLDDAVGREDVGGSGGSDGRDERGEAALMAAVERAPALATWRVEGPTIEDTAWRRLPLTSPLDGISGRPLALVFARDEAGGNAPSLMRSEGDVYPDGRSIAAGVPVDGDLDFRLELRPGRLGRAAHRLALSHLPEALTAALVVGGIASALAFLYLSVLRPPAPPH